MKFNQGNSSFVILILLFASLSIGTMFYILQLNELDKRVDSVNNDSVNLTGISYNTPVFNATSNLTHTLGGEVLPVFGWVVLAFMAICICAFVYAIVKR